MFWVGLGIGLVVGSAMAVGFICLCAGTDVDDYPTGGDDSG